MRRYVDGLVVGLVAGLVALAAGCSSTDTRADPVTTSVPSTSIPLPAAAPLTTLGGAPPQTPAPATVLVAPNTSAAAPGDPASGTPSTVSPTLPPTTLPSTTLPGTAAGPSPGSSPGSSTPAAPASPTTAPSTTVPAPVDAYVIVRGDTLYGTARAFNVTLDQLLAANDPAATEVIHVGDVLRLPAGARPLRPTDVTTSRYTVVAGDTITDIAGRHDTTPAQLLALNDMLATPNQLQVGQILMIPEFG